MRCHAQYLSGELAEGGAFVTQEQAEHWVVRTLHVVHAFYQYCWLLLSPPFAILLNWPHPNPWVFAFFLLILLPIPLGRGKERESNCVGSLLQLRQTSNNCLLFTAETKMFDCRDITQCQNTFHRITHFWTSSKLFSFILEWEYCCYYLGF